MSLVFAGCSGSTPEKVERDGSAGQGQGARAGAPEPRGDVDRVARELASAVRRKDCAALRRLSFSGIPKSDGADCKKLLAQLKGLKPGNSAEYGTAAVVDFKTAKKPTTLAFLTNAQGEYRWALRFPRREGRAIAGTQPPEGNTLDATAATAVEALRTGRCQQLLSAARGILPQPQIPVKTCERRAGLRKRLSQDPAARPMLLGANARLAFYSLRPSPRGPYDTLVLVQQGKRSAFLRDVPIAAGPKKK